MKPTSDFYRDKSSKDGYRATCKTCFARSATRLRDREANTEYMRNYRARPLVRPTWDETWAKLALDMSDRSRCAHAKIGAVIVSAENAVVATGYNGPPSGYILAKTESCLDWCERGQAHQEKVPLLDLKYEDCPSNHSEINALMRSSYHDRVGGTIYVTGAVCMACAKAIANSGISTVALVNADDERDSYRHPERVREFLVDCGLVVTDVVVAA